MSPRGLDKIQERAKESAQRQADFVPGSGQRALMLKAGQTARVRFLEEGGGVWYLYTHDLPKKPGQQYSDKILCADQPFTDAESVGYVEASKPCYACELEGVGRSARVVINLIRFDEPKLVRDAQGKALKDAQQNFVFDGVEPALLVWNTSQQVGGRLAYLESTHGGLTRHVCTLHKTPDKNNAWMVDVVEVNKAPTPEEHDLNSKKLEPPKAIQNVFPKYLALPLLSYGDMKRAYSGASVPSGFQGGDGQAQSDNVYAQAAQQAASGVELNLGAFDS